MPCIHLFEQLKGHSPALVPIKVPGVSPASLHPGIRSPEEMAQFGDQRLMMNDWFHQHRFAPNAFGLPLSGGLGINPNLISFSPNMDAKNAPRRRQPQFSYPQHANPLMTDNLSLYGRLPKGLNGGLFDVYSNNMMQSALFKTQIPLTQSSENKSVPSFEGDNVSA
jgi:hypothetical protein